MSSKKPLKICILGTVGVFWGIERLVGLAGAPGDIKTIIEYIDIIPDAIGGAVIALFALLSWQQWGDAVKAYVSNSLGLVSISYCSNGEPWSTMSIKRMPGLLHRIPLKDDGQASIIEINRKWKIWFVDMPNSEHFWLEDTANKSDDLRRYVCRQIDKGYGYKEAKFTIETSLEE